MAIRGLPFSFPLIPWFLTSFEERAHAEGLASALARQPQHIMAEPPLAEVIDAEAKYGAKLDKMLGGLARLQRGPDTPD